MGEGGAGLVEDSISLDDTCMPMCEVDNTFMMTAIDLKNSTIAGHALWEISNTRSLWTATARSVGLLYHPVSNHTSKRAL